MHNQWSAAIDEVRFHFRLCKSRHCRANICCMNGEKKIICKTALDMAENDEMWMWILHRIMYEPYTILLVPVKLNFEASGKSIILMSDCWFFDSFNMRANSLPSDQSTLPQTKLVVYLDLVSFKCISTNYQHFYHLIKQLRFPN